ncbi:MAG: TIGR03089 family protein [Nostocoides sp.]
MTYATDLLTALRTSDETRPRLTVYDDTDGPSRGERIELSAKVLDNWVAKAANLLQEEFDAGPGTSVTLGLPPHWRTAYWALAAWSVGARLDLGRGSGNFGSPDLVISQDPTVAGLCVLVTLPALARSATMGLPAGVIDEACELANYADQFSVWRVPAPTDPALAVPPGNTITYAELPAWGVSYPREARVHTSTSGTPTFLAQVLGCFACDGSLVLSRGPDGDLSARLRQERITHPVS